MTTITVGDDLNSLKSRNWRLVWKPFMEKYNCQTICELGVFQGENFELMIEHNPQLAVAVDSWIGMDEKLENFQKSVAEKPFVKIIRDDSANAAKLFPDNYFDFVYIDADHSFEACTKDIASWYPKVKPGKFLAGHDYRQGFGVTPAVRNLVRQNNLEFFFRPASFWVTIKKSKSLK